MNSPAEERAVRLKRRAKGKRPFYFSDPDVDRLLSMIMALTAELSVTRDRLDTLERVAAEKGLFSGEDIELFAHSEESLSARSVRHAQLVQEVTRIITSELEGLGNMDETDYEEVVRTVESDA
jgi:hypothetical protein